MNISIKKVFFILTILFFSAFVNRYSNAVKIVAFVNEGIVTDFDVDEFEKVLCKFDKRFKCGSQNSRQMAMLGLIESTLKIEHFKQIDFGPDKDNIIKGFDDYKKQVLTNIKISEKKAPKSFIDYLYSEYIWGIMISSQIKQDDITEEMLRDFARLNNIKTNNLEQIKQMYMQDKSNSLSQKTLSDLKKFYLVDVRGL